MEYEVVERLMKEKGVKASDVAKATGIPQSVFTDWKKGRYTPIIRRRASKTRERR